LALIHTSGSQPVHSNTCEAGPSLGPAGAEIGRSLLQHQHGPERRSRLNVEDGRVIVEEEEEGEAESAEIAAAAQIPVGTATMSTRSNSISSKGNSSSNSQHTSTPELAAKQDQQVGSGPAQLGDREHQHGKMLAAGEVNTAEQPDGRKDRPHMGTVFLGIVSNMSRWCQHTWTSMSAKGTRWRQQGTSLASRTWTSVHAKRGGPDAMIGILAVFVLAALVCGWFVAYCRGEPVRRHDRRLRTAIGGNRHLTLPPSPGGRGSNRGSHSNSPGGCSSLPVPSSGIGQLVSINEYPLQWKRKQ